MLDPEVTEANNNALQTIVDEFKNISPEIKNVYIFSKDCETLASTEPFDGRQMKILLEAFKMVADRAAAIGGVESVTIQGSDSQLNIVRLNDRYIATVTSELEDEKAVKSLTRVIIPTVIKLIDQISLESSPESSITDLPQLEEQTEDKPAEGSIFSDGSPAQNELSIENTSTPAEGSNFSDESSAQNELPIETKSTSPFTSESDISTAPANQFMVEKISGLMVPADTVRINNEVIATWTDLYGEKQITQVHIETLEGEETTCKFKPIKETKQNLKGMIQLPEKILQALKTSKGKLVLVKPVVPT